MSLVKEECERCWLPPQTGKLLCRKCTDKSQHEVKWIRYHQPSSDCKQFRSLILSDSYYGAALPENCIECCNFLLSIHKWVDAVKICISVRRHEEIVILFRRELENRRDALLEYVSNLLSQFIEDLPMCKRILTGLIDASNGRTNWILEELVQRPASYPSLLQSPILIPYYLTEDFFEQIEDMNIWWALWEKMPAATMRRIRFRCMKIKGELLEKTWAPSRVLKWCIDFEESGSINADWLHK